MNSRLTAKGLLGIWRQPGKQSNVQNVKKHPTWLPYRVSPYPRAVNGLMLERHEALAANAGRLRLTEP
jgi:hypothetical protein